MLGILPQILPKSELLAKILRKLPSQARYVESKPQNKT